MPATQRTTAESKAKTPRTAAAPKPWISKTAGMPVPARVDALRDALVDAIEQEVDQRNVRVILWLADKLKVLDAGLQADRKPTDELRSFFSELNSGELREFAGLASQQE